MALAANSLEGKAEKYIARIETLLTEIESERGAFMAKAKEIRGDVKEIYFEAKQAGVPVKALRGLIKHRELSKRQDKIKDGMDIDEASTFETLVDALGDLGRAAARAAGYAPKDDDSRDLRPPHLVRNDETRADQEHLNKLGRGPVA